MIFSGKSSGHVNFLNLGPLISANKRIDTSGNVNCKDFIELQNQRAIVSVHIKSEIVECTVLYCLPYCLVVSYMPPPQDLKELLLSNHLI
jgi:hypothetical protein